MKYIVECQALEKIEIEAESREEAEHQALLEITLRKDTFDIDWCISAHEQKSEYVYEPEPYNPELMKESD
jgi:hypothetical protein